MKKKKIFQNENNFSSHDVDVYNDLLNEKMHSLELTNWLNFNN